MQSEHYQKVDTVWSMFVFTAKNLQNVSWRSFFLCLSSSLGCSGSRDMRSSLWAYEVMTDEWPARVCPSLLFPQTQTPAHAYLKSQWKHTQYLTHCPHSLTDRQTTTWLGFIHSFDSRSFMYIPCHALLVHKKSIQIATGKSKATFSKPVKWWTRLSLPL